MEEEHFQTLYTALWKKPLDSILHDAPADASGTVLKHIPHAVLMKLKLEYMHYQDEVLLIREEYITAFNTFKNWNRVERGGGVVVTGQRGIGAF